MKSVIGILVLFLSCQLCFGQVLTRKTVHGKVVNDSIAIENGLVFNLNAKTGAVIDNKGYFSILAKVKDTLVFTSLGFKSKKVVLSQTDITSSFYRIKLNAVANQLLAVVVYAKNGPHPEFGNTQKLVDTQYYDDQQSSPDNILMMPSGTGDPNNLDVIRVYNKIFKNLFKNNPNKTDLVSDVSFTTIAMQSVSYSFFTDKLKLKEDEVGLFLLFCENDPKSKTFVKINQQFEVMDFLITKNNEFKNIATFEK
ncbi:carboxypeptidase-like regulatory domain-containing protein [Flavobacterium taihuense]|uniref:Carboxypeptidase-like regulatory domain-containing protein n=1 Tax=Flavobacterium taihuense TaxID=2857508 RepID=A0ABS6XSP8_9FLAO|nr:carboxypeptidase-like regulatory domain-containing protein [Flavobacterium taihuense]MBW4359690.1 carboxypeptidase-like regulatory domain-containing protein [Flavobacterium taihuense]